jgi:hypothetical protein
MDLQMGIGQFLTHMALWVYHILTIWGDCSYLLNQDYDVVVVVDQLKVQIGNILVESHLLASGEVEQVGNTALDIRFRRNRLPLHLL